VIVATAHGLASTYRTEYSTSISNAKPQYARDDAACEDSACRVPQSFAAEH
jgi:hypothetical protein